NAAKAGYVDPRSRADVDPRVVGILNQGTGQSIDGYRRTRSVERRSTGESHKPPESVDFGGPELIEAHGLGAVGIRKDQSETSLPKSQVAERSSEEWIGVGTSSGGTGQVSQLDRVASRQIDVADCGGGSGRLKQA